MQSDTDFMHLAIRLATENVRSGRGGPFAAVVVKNGEIVAALIDGESTLKRYLLDHGEPFLKAENPIYPDLLPAAELVIQGVMIGLLRRVP